MRSWGSFSGLVVGLLAALGLLCGCRNRLTNVDRGNREQILHLGNSSEPKDLDPHIVTGVPEHNIISALLEGLVSEDPKTLEPIPGTAEAWTVSEDGLVYTFKLRQDAMWSNGHPLTAGDFVFSYKRILSPGLGSAYAYMLYCLKNAEPFNKGLLKDFSQVGARAIADNALELSLRAPTPYFLSLLNHFSWFPVHPRTVLKFGNIDTIGSKWTRPDTYVGNGPFILRTWQPGRKITVVKNSTYWDHEAVALKGICFYPIGNHKIEERAFRAGQLHVTGTVPIDRIQWYVENEPAVLRLDPYLGTYYYLFNVTRPPLDDARVRRALALSVDREQLVKYITKAGESPAYHFTPPDTAGYTAKARIHGSVLEAKRLMREAGYPDAKNFPRLQILYNTSEAHARIAQAIHQMWKTALGIDVELVNMEWKVYLAKTEERKYDIARAGWIGDYVDPNTFLDMWVTDGGNNRAGWSNPDYDRLIKQAARTCDKAERMALFQKAERILMVEVPIMPLYFYRSKSLIQPSVGNWHPTIIDHHPYKYIRLEVSP